MAEKGSGTPFRTAPAEKNTAYYSILSAIYRTRLPLELRTLSDPIPAY